MWTQALFSGHPCSLTVHVAANFLLSCDRLQLSNAWPLLAESMGKGQKTAESIKKAILFWGRRKFKGMSKSCVTSSVTNTGKMTMSNFISFINIDAISGYLFTILNCTSDHPCNSAVRFPRHFEWTTGIFSCLFTLWKGF